MSDPHSILLFLASGFEDLEAAAVIDTCGWTSYHPDLPNVRVVTAGLTRNVVGRFGSSVTVDQLLEEIDPGAYSAIALPGGFDSHGYAEEAYDSHLRQLLQTMHRNGAV